VPYVVGFCSKARTSEAEDCSQNANMHRPLVDMGMLEKSWFNYETTIILEIQFYLGFVKQLFIQKCTIAESEALLFM
jgi:hypothetical protein